MSHLQPQLAQPSVANPVRQRILAAGRQHFFAHGFRGVTMDDLAAELAMSKKTLYTHFASKTALLEAILLEKFAGIEAEVAKISTEHSGDFSTSLHELLACVMRQTEEIKPPFVRDLQREAPEIFRVVEGRRRELIQRYFGKLLGEGQREGLIRTDLPLQFLIDILLGATQAVVNPPKLVEFGLTPRTGFAAVISVILQGIVTDAGRAKL